jgi:hypothetical protein
MSGCQKCGQSCYCDIDANGRGFHDHTAAFYKEGRRKALQEVAAWLWPRLRGHLDPDCCLVLEYRARRDEAMAAKRIDSVSTATGSVKSARAIAMEQETARRRAEMRRLEMMQVEDSAARHAKEKLRELGLWSEG